MGGGNSSRAQFANTSSVSFHFTLKKLMVGQVGEIQDNLQRAAEMEHLDPMKQEEMDDIAAKSSVKWFAETVVREVEAETRLWYQSYSCSIRDMARAFPACHVQTFEVQFPQYNLTEIFGLNPQSGLSNYLSFYPKDPKYLQPLQRDADGLPLQSKDGKMTGSLKKLLLTSNLPFYPVHIIGLWFVKGPD